MDNVPSSEWVFTSTIFHSPFVSFGISLCCMVGCGIDGRYDFDVDVDDVCDDEFCDADLL